MAQQYSTYIIHMYNASHLVRKHVKKQRTRHLTNTTRYTWYAHTQKKNEVEKRAEGTKRLCPGGLITPPPEDVVVFVSDGSCLKTAKRRNMDPIYEKNTNNTAVTLGETNARKRRFPPNTVVT